VTRPFLGASVQGSSAWIVHQLLNAPLQQRIRQLECDPHVPGEVVRHLRMTAAAIGEAARQYREAVTSAVSVADSVEVNSGGTDAGLGQLPNRWGVAETAASLGCSRRWVRALVSQGRLVAVKAGREWRVDVDSIEDYRRGVAA
jgi:excisionase family DNA binding protein